MIHKSVHYDPETHLKADQTVQKRSGDGREMATTDEVGGTKAALGDRWRWRIHLVERRCRSWRGHGESLESKLDGAAGVRRRGEGWQGWVTLGEVAAERQSPEELMSVSVASRRGDEHCVKGR
jgi:hypothetical protein